MKNIERLRAIKFRDFCDRFLDKLDKEYDFAGEEWLNLFREEVFVSLMSLRQKVEKTLVYLRTFDNDEVFRKVIDDFLENKDSNENLDLPAFERLLPVLRSLNIKDDDNFASVLAILAYAKASKSETQKDNKA